MVIAVFMAQVTKLAFMKKNGAKIIYPKRFSDFVRRTKATL
jgi:hypothetical protein